jgi:hypothetical protein
MSRGKCKKVKKFLGKAKPPGDNSGRSAGEILPTNYVSIHSPLIEARQVDAGEIPNPNYVSIHTPLAG